MEHYQELQSTADIAYLIKSAVCLQFFVVGVLDENRDVSHLGCHCRVIVHHGDGRFLCAHF